MSTTNTQGAMGIQESEATKEEHTPDTKPQTEEQRDYYRLLTELMLYMTTLTSTT